MRELTHLSLFSGIGGLDLAAEWAGFRTVGQCEWADYPRAVLEKHWPGLTRWRDIRTLTKESFYEQTGLETVTVLSGGFPCQPFSTAGKRRGKDDDRYLWPEMLRVISQIRPRWVVGENVAGIVSMALDTVLSDLESIGYACEAVIIPACAVDAPHRRDRCAILAYANNSQTSRQREYSGEIHPEPKTEGLDLCSCHVAHSQSERRGEAGECVCRSSQRTSGSSSFVADPPCGGEQRPFSSGSKTWGSCSSGCNAPNTDNQRLQIPGYEPGFQTVQPKDRIELGYRWPAEPDVGRVAHGVPNRVDRLKCLGNAVVPHQFYPFFKAIADIENNL